MKASNSRPWMHWWLLACSALLAAPEAIHAQATDEGVGEVIEEIVTTGSRIRRDDFSSSTPMTVIDGQAIVDQGLSNLGEALRQQTAVGTGGFNQSSILSGGGATSVDLRNLGPERVLILINGRRVASFADALANQAADLTFIPTAMVDRVEILRDGASAVYGSDAITGVINVILKDDFEGVEANLQTGATTESDGENHSISLTMGTTTERGNFVAGAEFRRQDAVKQRDRDWAFPAISALRANDLDIGSVFSPAGVFLGDGGAIFCTRPKALGGDEVTDVSGTDPTVCGTAAGQAISDPDQAVLNRYDYALEQDLVIASEVVSTSFFGNYALSESANAFVESQFSKRTGTRALDGNPGSFGTPAFPDGTRVPASNPNNPTGEDGIFLFRPTSTIGPRTQEQESNTFRIVAGVEGDLPVGSGWFYEASALYTRVDAELNTNYVWNLARFIRISDPDLCAADALCASTVNPSGALDSFRPGNWTQAEIEYMRHTNSGTSKFETNGYQAFVSGPVLDLPAGSLNLALGIEHRRDSGFNQPDSVTESGESVSNQVFTTQGEFEVDEVFTEIDVPLLASMPAAEELTLNLQWRYSDYDTFGSEDVYRVGLNWQITDWARIRANTSTAYRAPQVTDLFGGGTVSFDFFNDVCDAGASGITPGSNEYENCLLDGVDPETFTQPTSQYSVLAGSNPELQPETADTATYGVVLTPGGFLEGLQMSLDFWDIEVEDLISRNSSDSILLACYEGPVGLTAPECEQFDRNPNTGVPVGFVNRLSNLDNVETNGFDAGINYAFEGFADTLWSVTAVGTYVDENTFLPGAGGADQEGSIPRLQANLTTDVVFRDWTVSWSMRYVSSMNDPDFDGNNALGYDGVPSYDKHDLRVAYNWDKYRLLVGINNLTDEDPPYVFSTGNNTDTFLYDVFGRFWFARLTLSLQ